MADMENTNVSASQVDHIVRELNAGRSLEEVCAELGVKVASFYSWYRHHANDRLPILSSDVKPYGSRFRSNPLKVLVSDYFGYSGEFSRSAKGLLGRMVPILLVSALVTIVLQYDLLIMVGLLFCYWVYDSARPKQLHTAVADNNRLFILVILFTLCSKLLFLWKQRYLGHQSLHGTVLNPIMLYQLCYLSVSYQVFGFVKRGLIPSIVRIVSGDYLVQLYLVQFIGLVTFITGLMVMNRSKVFSMVQRRTFIPALLLSPVGIYYCFNFTFGFYDMTLLGILFLSFSFRKRPAALLLDVTGLLIHEAYIFLRLPFLLFDLYHAWRAKKSAYSAWVSLTVNVVATLLILSWPKPSTLSLENNYLHQYSTLKGLTLPVDFDAFLPLSREGTLFTDFHIMRRFYDTEKFLSFYFPVSMSLLSIGLLSFFTSRLPGKYRILDLCCSLFSFSFPLLLMLVGADIGRWLEFSYVTWLSYYVLFRPVLFIQARIAENCLYGVLLTALLFIPFGYNFHPLLMRLLG